MSTLLSSRSMSPESEAQDPTWFLSSRGVEMRAYGSYSVGGEREVKAYFHFCSYRDLELQRLDGENNIISEMHETDHEVFNCLIPIECLSGRPQEFHFGLTSFFSSLELFQATKNLILEGLPSFCQDMIEEAQRRGFTRLDVQLDIHEHVLEYYDEMDLSREEEWPLGMVPAAASSIVDGLKKKTVGAKETEQRCTVCMSDFSLGEDVAEMPCGHIYHRDCIIPWLKTSHYCPICRYEMPTDQ